MLTFHANLSFVYCQFTSLNYKLCLNDIFISLVEHHW